MDNARYVEVLTREAIPKSHAFSEIEYQARLSKVREGMGSAGVDILLVTAPANIAYVSGYNAFGIGGARRRSAGEVIVERE